MQPLTVINVVLAAIFILSLVHRVVFFIVKCVRTSKPCEAQKLCRYAVLIAARNEENVVGQLIDSVIAQDYPSDLVDVYVVADNCTDRTAAVAKAHGARVFERSDEERIGKGYAVRFLIASIKRDFADKQYDGYFVFDADNVIARNYITEMNKYFSCGHRIVLGYRNAKNFGDNWITASYGLYFLNESENANTARGILDTSCFLSGTGYVFADGLLDGDGWRWLSLTEDLEFTAEMLCRGEKIAYCETAELYDEQPRSFMTSVRQRARWLKGNRKAISKYRSGLLGKFFKKGGFACYDFIMNAAQLVIWQIAVLINLVGITVMLALGQSVTGYLIFYAAAVVAAYIVMFFMGFTVAVSERERIKCPFRRVIAYSFTFPIFMFSFIPVFFFDYFGKAEWRPIRHESAVSIEELEDRCGK